MGGRIAVRLLQAGHNVVGWNRSPGKAADFETAGGQVAATPAQAVRRAEVVITMLADINAVLSVAVGPGGFAGSLDRSATVIEMSTIGPDGVARLADALPPDAGLLDAPVLGSITEVDAGDLEIFVGGPQDLVDRWMPLLRDLGTPTHFGPLGTGAAAKLVANSTLLATLGLLGETLALADGLGLSRDQAFAVLALTPLAAPAQRRRSAIESGHFQHRFGLSLARKDAELVAAAAAAHGVDLRLLPGLRSWFADADAAGLGDQDYSAVLAHILRSAQRPE